MNVITVYILKNENGMRTAAFSSKRQAEKKLEEEYSYIEEGWEIEPVALHYSLDFLKKMYFEYIGYLEEEKKGE